MSRIDVRDELLAERDEVVATFRAAIDALDVVEPVTLREPLSWVFTGKIALCMAHTSVLGLSVNYALEAARVIIEEKRVRTEKS